MPPNEVVIRISAKNLASKTINAIAGQMKRLGRAGLSIGRGFRTGAAIAARAITVMAGAVTAAATVLIKFGSDADEVANKFQAVFSGIQGEANAMAKALSKEFRITGTEAKKLLSDTGDLLTGFGFTQDQALQLSDSVQRLAADLASFTNIEGGTAKASQALTKLLLGESEQAKALGIVVRQGSEEYKTAVAAKMEHLGVTTLQAKAIVALEMATEQSKNAIGDAAKTASSAANAMKSMRSAIIGVIEKLGQSIIVGLDFGNVMLKWGDALRDFMDSQAFVNISEKLRTWMHDAKTIVETIAKGGDARGEVITALSDVLKSALAVGAEKAIDLLTRGAKQVGVLIAKGFADATRALAAKMGERSVARDIVLKQMGGELGSPTRGATKDKIRFLGLEEELEKRINDELIKQSGLLDDNGIATNAMTLNELALVAAIEKLNKFKTNQLSTEDQLADLRLAERGELMAMAEWEKQHRIQDAEDKDKVAAAQLRRDKEIIKERDAAARKAHQNRIDELNAEIAKAVEAANAANDALAKLKGQGLAGAIGALRDQRALGAFGETPQQAKDQAEINNLLKKEGRRGFKLSREGQEMLDAFRKQEADKARIKGEVDKEKAKAVAGKKALDKLKAEEMARDIRKITALENIERDLKILLRAPGGA